MKRSAFVILKRSDSNQILCVYNRKKKIGFPGGKEEKCDNGGLPVGTLHSAQFANACREFQEETGIELPYIDFNQFCWGDPRYHIITIFYATIHAEIADMMGGEVNDPYGDIVSCSWNTQDFLNNSKNILHHIRKAYNIWKEKS